MDSMLGVYPMPFVHNNLFMLQISSKLNENIKRQTKQSILNGNKIVLLFLEINISHVATNDWQKERETKIGKLLAFVWGLMSQSDDFTKFQIYIQCKKIIQDFFFLLNST